MGLLDRFEDRLDHLVNGAFARAFKADVQPVEIAAAIQRDMDDRVAVIGRRHGLAPNVFRIALSRQDDERLAVFRGVIEEELANVVSGYATEQGYRLLGAPAVTLGPDDSLRTGVFRVSSQAVQQSPKQRLPYLSIDGVHHQMTKAITRVGRGVDSDIQVKDPAMSRVHFEIVHGTPVMLHDLGSANGTAVDGRLVARVALSDGSIIQVGSTTMTFHSGLHH